MVRVHFVLDDVEVQAPSGTELQAIAEAAQADLTFGCRTATCGTCRVKVEGAEGSCSAPTPEERDFLRALNAPVDQRLACQLRVLGDLRIDYLGV